MNQEAFIDLPQRGLTEWWRYALGYVTVLFSWLVVGSIPAAGLVVWMMIDGNPDTYVDLATGAFMGIDAMLVFVVVNSSFWFLLLGLFVAVRLIHQRPFRTLITPFRHISWRRVAQGFVVFFALVALASLVEFLLTPEIYTVTFNGRRLLPFALLVLLLTPLQTSAEELLFRGYVLQTSGQLLRNPILLSAINGLLFMLPHLANPEMQASAILLPLYYFGIGFFLAFITLRDNRMELALGAHAANNIYAGIVTNYDKSALTTDSIFLVTELNAVFGLVSFVFIAMLFYLLLLRRVPTQEPPTL